MDGGQLMNKTESMKLKDRVNFEIGTHGTLKLSNYETFTLYWFGSFMKSDHSLFIN